MHPLNLQPTALHQRAATSTAGNMIGASTNRGFATEKSLPFWWQGTTLAQFGSMIRTCSENRPFTAFNAYVSCLCAISSYSPSGSIFKQFSSVFFSGVTFKRATTKLHQCNLQTDGMMKPVQHWLLMDYSPDCYAGKWMHPNVLLQLWRVKIIKGSCQQRFN